MASTLSGLVPRRLPEHTAPVRRVRHEVRDGMAVIAFSAAASTALALALLLLARAAG